jgi:amino acid permease
MADRKLISREEVLEGLGGRVNKQAATVLALIEGRTSYLIAHAQQVANTALAVAATQSPNQAYLAALAEGREKQPSPTIQAIERFAPQWSVLVPDNPTIRAAVAHLLGQHYVFTAAAVPGLRAALGLDGEAVQQAYGRLFHQPLATIYAPQVQLLDRLRWAWSAFSARLETLPPFWLTFFLTLPAVSGLMALPIALTPVGPLWGVLIIVCFGLVNMLTAAALAETVVRSGTARFGLGFLGQLAQEYLGASASTLVTIVLAASNFPVLIIFFLGVGSTLNGATGLPATFWMVLLLGAVLYFLAQRSLNATVTTTLLIVFTNLGIVGAVLLLALPYFQWDNLASSARASTFTPAAIGSIVGILSATFLSHFLLATYGPAVLPRDPGGRAWVRGSIAAMLVMTLIACLWLVVISGVVSPQMLRSATGTVVTPLAAIVGPVVSVLGALLVILSIGLATIQVGLAQYYSVEERLPVRGSASWIGGLSERQRYWVAVSPMFLVLGLAVWLVISGTGSFANLLGTVNALALPLLTGIIPLLLLVATRRKGDFVPSAPLHWLGHSGIVWLLYGLFIVIILIHGGYIWSAWPLRIFALGGGLVILAVTWDTWRQGLAAGRLVFEICQDEQLAGQSRFSIVEGGQPQVAAVTLHYGDRQQQYQSATGAISDFADLQRVTFQVPATSTKQLKVWVHRLNEAGASLDLPAQVQVQVDGQAAVAATITGPLLTPLPGRDCQVTVTMTGKLESSGNV